ncbi:hypothetical protein D9O50_12125 [Oxalobacteraceae bacterium CAVE-383]|nr:hypothetical protein D9O50_12125 [Oxalobacteraceae bacterium CAVE-383]
MDKVSSKEACRMAVDLIEAQLRVLPLSIAMLSSLDLTSGPGRIPDTIRLPRKPRAAKTGSAAVIAAAGAGLSTEAHLVFDLSASQQALQNNPSRLIHDQRILVGNSLLAVGMFLKENGISATRTPEVQFLGHVCNAIINGNTFRIESGYVPGASFDGLIIDSSLDGARLFGDDVEEGFMAFGDAVALLQRLAQYLRGTQEFVSGGDAG